MVDTVVEVFDNFDFVEALYWAVVTGTTVGFGDYSASHSSSRWFLIFYLWVIVIAMGNFLNAFQTWMYVRLHQHHQHHQHHGLVVITLLVTLAACLRSTSWHHAAFETLAVSSFYPLLSRTLAMPMYQLHTPCILLPRFCDVMLHFWEKQASLGKNVCFLGFF